MRMLALLRKELADERQNPALFVPALIVAFVSVLLPVFVAVIVPYMTGERLSDSGDFAVALELYRDQPETRALDPEAAIQAYLFQFFAVMLVLIPVTSSMSLAAYSVVGEKQARSLEPLLVTPITTFELLAAKVLGAFIPSIVLSAGSFVAYVLLSARFCQTRRRVGPAGTALNRHRLRARPARRARRAADGRLRVVTGQRCQDCPADRGAGDSAHTWPADRPADRRLPADCSGDCC